MFRKENLIVNYFCPKTNADSQIADIDFMEGTKEEAFYKDLHEWLINFAFDWWENDLESSEDDEIYIQEITDEGKSIKLDSIKKMFFNNSYQYNAIDEDEPFDSDKEPDVDFNGGMDWN